MKDCIKSRFTGDTIFNGICVLILPITGGMFFMFRIVSDFLSGKFRTITDILISFFFFLFFLFMLSFIKYIRYLIIKDNTLKYYSLLVPFGKTLYFNDYIGEIVASETGSGGSYDVVYFVDKNNMTAFKIMGLHYKNFEEINNAIPLKKISFSPTTWQYFKLLFTGKIKVEKSDNKSGDRLKKTNTQRIIKKVTIAVVSIGLILFVLGIVVKILSKITGNV
jgi:uncharacterized membrane protein